MVSGIDQSTGDGGAKQDTEASQEETYANANAASYFRQDVRDAAGRARTPLQTDRERIPPM